MKYTLNIVIDDDKVRHKYLDAVDNMHTNEYLSNTNKDSGFDIYIPQDHKFDPYETHLVDLGIKCVMIDNSGEVHTSSSYYLYSRSSIYKTPFRLANNVGIIDSGYRGNLKGAFDNITDQSQIMKANTRLLQICAPDLSPFKVNICKELNHTSRGNKGFGSSGV
jgi:dUTP pyrophosphatase